MTGTPILAGERFSPEKNREIAERFFRDGFVHIPGVLTQEEVEAIREKTDELLDNPDLQARFNPDLGDPRYAQVREHDTSGEQLPFILRNTIELDQIFRDMLVVRNL